MVLVADLKKCKKKSKLKCIIKLWEEIMTKFTWDKLLCDKRLSSLGNNSINKNKE